MHEKAIARLDRAAVALIQALEAEGHELRPYLEAQHLERVRSELVNLRRELLGLEMGLLYQDWTVPAELLDSALSSEAQSVEEAAARVAQRLNRDQAEGDPA